MSKRSSKPPKIALFLLRHLYPERTGEPMAGDLRELFMEGRPMAWLLGQVLVAVAIAGVIHLRRIAADIVASIAALIAISVVPWTELFPLRSMATPAMRWADRLGWLLQLDATTAILVTIILATLFFARRTFKWVRVFQIFLLAFALLTAADFLILKWNLNHPVTQFSEAAFMVRIQWLCISAVQLALFCFVRRLSNGQRSSARS